MAGATCTARRLASGINSNRFSQSSRRNQRMARWQMGQFPSKMSACCATPVIICGAAARAQMLQICGWGKNV
jgi:hypothetical protein